MSRKSDTYKDKIRFLDPYVSEFIQASVEQYRVSDRGFLTVVVDVSGQLKTVKYMLSADIPSLAAVEAMHRVPNGELCDALVERVAEYDPMSEAVVLLVSDVDRSLGVYRLKSGIPHSQPDWTQ